MFNGHGDVTALLDVTTNNLRAQYNYDAFGNITTEQYFNSNGTTATSPTITSSNLFGEYQYDKESKRYYLNSRMYDPVTARFLQQDTYAGNSGDPLSLNLYTYCHNEPLMYLDPTGHWEEGDDNLSRNGQLLTQYYGILWREATTQEEKDRYHGYAIAVGAYEANKSGGVFNHLVMEGSYTKSDLRSLQQLLKDEKYDIKVDGIWGNETANVLWAYQFKHFSEAKDHDEKAGKKTWATFLPSLYDNMNITEYYNHVVNKIASVTATVERSGATPVQTNPYESVNKSNSSQGTSKGDGIVQRVLDSADKALSLEHHYFTRRKFNYLIPLRYFTLIAARYFNPLRIYRCTGFTHIIRQPHANRFIKSSFYAGKYFPYITAYLLAVLKILGCLYTSF